MLHCLSRCIQKILKIFTMIAIGHINTFLAYKWMEIISTGNTFYLAGKLCPWQIL